VSDPVAPPEQRSGGAASLFRGTAAAAGAAAAIIAVSSAVAALVFSLWPGIRPEPPPRELSATISKLAVEPNVSFADYLARVGALEEYGRLRSELLDSIATKRLRPGDSGPKIVALQTLLTQQGLYAGPASGKFNVATLTAVKTFQQHSGAYADGAVGSQTFQALLKSDPTNFRQRGLAVYVAVRVEGFRVRQFGPLRAHLYNAGTHARVRGRAAVSLAQLLRPLLPPERARSLVQLGEITNSHVRPAAPVDQRGKQIWLSAPPTPGRYYVRVELRDLTGELVDFADTEAFRQT
jgi:hypothetical protein